MIENVKLKIKAIGEKLLFFVSGGTGMTQEVRIRENKEYRKRKKAEQAKKHRY